MARTGLLQRLDEDHTAFFLSTDAVAMLFQQPTIVFRTPALFLYDAATETLSQTDALTLERRFEVGDTVVTRLIDIVSVAGVSAMIDRYKRAIVRLRESAERNALEIVKVATTQRQRREREVTEKLADEFGRWRS